MSEIAEPRIEQLSEKKLVGKHLHMSLANNRTVELWQSFMQQRKNIGQTLSTDLYSLQIYEPTLDFKEFNLQTEFEKWALIEVADFIEIPEGLKAFTLPAGQYAVFINRGLDFESTFRRIFYEWLPASGYALDQRPHFELLGAKYKNNSPDSEEEVWIPIKTETERRAEKQ
jgi:AraC family transcriptional regulator